MTCNFTLNTCVACVWTCNKGITLTYYIRVLHVSSPDTTRSLSLKSAAQTSILVPHCSAYFDGVQTAEENEPWLSPRSKKWNLVWPCTSCFSALQGVEMCVRRQYDLPDFEHWNASSSISCRKESGEEKKWREGKRHREKE